MQNTSCKSTCASHHSAVPLWCFLWWCGGVFVLLFFVVVFLWWCVCGGVLVLIFFCWCSRAGLFVVVFLWWCGRVCVMVFLCRCFCVGVVVFLWWCSCGGVLAVVFVWWCLCDKPQEEYAELLTIFTEKASKMIVLCDASDNFQRKRFQNDRFVRGFLHISKKKLPRWLFRAMLPTIFTDRTSKTSVSRDASDNFHRKNFQNDRFVRGFFQISQNHASKTSVSHDASDNFHRKSFQNDRFVRGFLQISQNNAPKTSVSRDASDNFHQKFAFRYSFAQSKRRFLREGSSAKSKMCLALQRRAFPNFKMYVSLQRRAQKCMNLSTAHRPASRTQKCNVLLQFWAIDTTFLARGFTASKWNLRFATVLGDRHHVFTARVARRQSKFTLGDRHHVFSERVDREKMKFAFRHSFGRSTTRF